MRSPSSALAASVNAAGSADRAPRCRTHRKLRPNSQLLQRAACARALGVPFCDVRLSRTKGGKPFVVRFVSVCASRDVQLPKY